MMDTVNTYTVKHIEKTLGISVSTVRKYALLLESHGYRISRNENNVRILYDADITVFRRIYEESTKGRTLDSIAMELATAQEETDIIKGNPPAPNDAALLRTLIEKVDTLTEKIDVMEASREEERRAFQMALRKYDEKYQEVIAMKEETAAAAEDVKPVKASSKWWQRFKK